MDYGVRRYLAYERWHFVRSHPLDLIVLDAERGAENANITTLPDALWWAATTVTTTGLGRLIAVAAQQHGGEVD